MVKAEVRTGCFLVSAYTLGRFYFSPFNIVITSEAKSEGMLSNDSPHSFPAVCGRAQAHAHSTVSVDIHNIQQLCWLLLMRTLNTAEVLLL